MFVFTFNYRNFFTQGEKDCDNWIYVDSIYVTEGFYHTKHYYTANKTYKNEI